MSMLGVTKSEKDTIDDLRTHVTLDDLVTDHARALVLGLAKSYKPQPECYDAWSRMHHAYESLPDVVKPLAEALLSSSRRQTNENDTQFTQRYNRQQLIFLHSISRLSKPGQISPK